MINPYQSSVTDPASRPLEPAGFVRGTVTFLLFSHQWILIGALYGVWVLAAQFLGHTPRPGLDDPKGIHLFVDVFYSLTLIWLVMFPVFAIVGFVRELFPNPQRSRTIPLRLARTFLFCLVWGTGFLFLRWDPHQVVYWFMD